MPSLKDLRGRIQSVKSTRQITKTMKMVAAAKMRKAQDACEKSRPYSDALLRVLTDLAKGMNSESAPLLMRGRESVNTVRIVVFGSDRGLCGGFNAHVGRKVRLMIEEQEKLGRQVELVTVGKKAREELRITHPKHIVKSYDDIGKTGQYGFAEEMANSLRHEFEKEAFDELHMVYARFESVMSQVPTPVQLIPFKADAEQGNSHASADYEPGEEAVLGTLLPLNISTQLFRGLLESQASEQGARMTAMDNATRNAGDMIKKLSLKYNRQRQAAITTEMIEIVSGAEAAV